MCEDMIYVVSGYMRSGTSMMMKCLSAAGLEACYSRQKDDILNMRYERDGYLPNPEGFFELGRKEFKNPEFVKKYSGKLIKVLHWRLETLPSYNYKVVFMTRDPKEIEVSYLKMFQRRPPFVLQKYDELVNRCVESLESNGIDVILVDHRDVIENPLSVFNEMKEKAWPITDIDKAVSAVNRKLYRSKKEGLDEARSEIPNLLTDLPHEILEK